MSNGGLSDKVTGGLWDRISGFFTSMWGEFWNVIEEPLKLVFRFPIDFILELFTSTSAKAHETHIDDFVKSQSNPDEVMKRLKSLAESDGILSILYHSMEFLITSGAITLQNASCTSELARQEINKSFTPMLPSIEYLIEAWYKDATNHENITELIKKSGISEVNRDMLLTASRSLLSAEETRDAFLRGEIDESQVDTILSSYHFNTEDIQVVKKLYQIIPPIQDIITMAVREVFSPEIVEKFGQMEDFPEEFGKWGEKKGLSKDWCRNYWAAHWRLPGVHDGYTMRHRDVINDEEMDILLRALDIMPFWREKLKEISYHPFTRVDVRRMHKIGVVDDDGLIRAYKDLGYNQEKAEAMSEFTLLYNQENDREISKTDILSLYKKHAINEVEVLEMLTAIGYTNDAADLLKIKADYEIYNSWKTRQISFYRKSYVNGKSTESEILSKLGNMNMPSAEINFLINTWNEERIHKVKSLTLEDLRLMYVANVIQESELMSELLELGYNTVDTYRFIQLFKGG